MDSMAAQPVEQSFLSDAYDALLDGDAVLQSSFEPSLHQLPQTLLDPSESSTGILPQFTSEDYTMQGQLDATQMSMPSYSPSPHCQTLNGIIVPESSLVAALDTPEMASDRKASESPPKSTTDADSPAYPLVAGDGFSAGDSPPHSQRDVSPQEPGDDELRVLESMLETISITLKSARAAKEHGHGAQAGLKLGQMKTNVLMMVDSLNDMQVPEGIEAAPVKLTPDASPEGDPGGGYLAVSHRSGMVKPDPERYTNPRKRNHSPMPNMESSRLVKLKTEDDDDVSLAVPADLSVEVVPPVSVLEHRLSLSPNAFSTLESRSSPHTLDFPPQDTYMQPDVYDSSAASTVAPLMEESFTVYPHVPPALPGMHDMVQGDQLHFGALSPTSPLPPLNEAALSYPSGSRNPVSWTNGCVPVPRRSHQMVPAMLSLIEAKPMRVLAPTYSIPPLAQPLYNDLPASVPIGRMSRSGTLSGGHPFAPFPPAYPSTMAPAPRSAPLISDYLQQQQQQQMNMSASAPPSRPGSPDDDADSPPSDRYTSNPGNEIPPEFRVEVDRIFFEFLNIVCSDECITDSKGEELHQKLMAKKMERLNSSRDFRPFKFRIQAFTGMFCDMLAKAGYPEDKLPIKKIRNYLWTSPYIMRFTPEGKKAKSKGNHVWNLEGRKIDDHAWEFKPWPRKISPSQILAATPGTEWSHRPKVWDPHGTRQNSTVTWSCSHLPPWLEWKRDTLVGIVPLDAMDFEITVEAAYMQHGVEERISRVLPVQVTHAGYSKRPLLNGDTRRTASDSLIPQSMSSRPVPASLPPSALSQPSMVPTQENHQILQVLEIVSSRVATAATTQAVITPSLPVVTTQSEVLHSLEAQRQLLQNTAAAFGQQLIGSELAVGTSDQGNSDMAEAAKQVVMSAAFSVAADNAATQVIVGGDAASGVTMDAVSLVTQSAVAQAVEMMEGTETNDVYMLIQAKKIIEHKTMNVSSDFLPMVDPPSHAASSDYLPLPMPDSPPRSHSTGSIQLLKQPYESPPAIDFPTSF